MPISLAEHHLLSIPSVCLILLAIGVLHWLVTDRRVLRNVCAAAAVCLFVALYLIPKLINHLNA